jgi:cysteinyl-tRNA synthetase
MIFNTLGGRKEEFKPLREGEVRIYVCGPTVYDYIHIGNARAFVIADVVCRYLEYKGFKVKLVRNITDIDDKMIKRARETGLSVQELGEIYSDAYFEDMEKLEIRKPNVNPRATQHIPEMIEAIQKLIDKGFAYEVDEDIYFDTSKFEDYGKLSANKAEAIRIGARIEVNPKKKNPSDFALWKAQKKGEIGWESPWGKGRPGWHIECSTMAMKYLGETIDIHMGGKDLIFPHHENEIAQAEAETGKPFVRYWLHNEWLTVDGRKMSKSLGNFITVRDALKMCEAMELKLFLILAHYRVPLDFNKENLEIAKTNLKKLQNSFERFKALKESDSHTSSVDELLSALEDGKRNFEEAMDDDFNTHLAISAILEIAKAMNIYVDKHKEIRASTKRMVMETFTRLLGVLGIKIPERKAEISEEGIVEGLMGLILDLREEFRKRKDWKIADDIRERLQKLGFVIEDKLEGTVWNLQM